MEILKEYRFKSNPLEKKFVDTFLDHFEKRNTMDLIIFGHGSESMEPKDYLSEREESIVVSTIQWLGSPVGQGFLNEYMKKEEDNG